MSLLIVGSVAFDGIETPYGKRDRILGGAATYISLAASFFTETGIVAVVGDDFSPADLAVFERRGIDTTGIERAAGKSFFWAGVYSADMNDRTTLDTQLNVFADFQPKIPNAYQGYSHLFLGNIDPGLQRSVQKQMQKAKVVGGDTMNFWISGQPEELKKTIAGWHMLLINDAEARQLSGEYNLLAAVVKIHAMGPQTIVIKRGEHGATLYRGGRVFAVPGFPLEIVRDPTGAGDCFAGGFMGYLASCGEVSEAALRRAMVYGSVLGSFCVEQFGTERLQALTRAEIDERYRHFQELMHFD